MNSPDVAHRATAKRGVLLVNLGTPEAPTASAIRRYLREFLSDRRVVEINPLLWWPVLHGFILPFRPLRLKHTYQSIWTPEGSPLLAISRRQRDALQLAVGPDTPVALAMRYGQPSIAQGLTALAQQQVRQLLVLPLYPQYSATTTASVLDAVFDVLRHWRWVPELRTVNHYHDHPAYIEALAASVEAHWRKQGQGEHLLISFHSIPLAYLMAGDPYFCHCHKTARLLAERLGLTDDRWSVSFQSRLGRTPWLQPYTEPHIVELAGSGVRQLDVICPGFAADCLETLEEIAIRYAQRFLDAGGHALRYIPALNDDANHIRLLQSLVAQHSQGWDELGDTAEDVARRLDRVAQVQRRL